MKKTFALVLSVTIALVGCATSTKDISADCASPTLPGFTLDGITTPASNIAGMRQVQDRIGVSLSIKGADKFGIDSNEVIKIVRAALSGTGVSLKKNGYDEVPRIHVSITGESTGGGGAAFTIELVIRAQIPSTFAKGRNIDAIIWRNSIADRHIMTFDPISKSFVVPSGAIKDRVYNATREVATHLAADIKISGTSE